MKKGRKALINYRIQRAYETMKEAKLMIRETFYNAAVNRMVFKRNTCRIINEANGGLRVNEGVRKGYPHLYGSAQHGRTALGCKSRTSLDSRNR